MFKIFENWDGSFTIIPYEFSDDIWSMVFMGIFVLLMGILGVSMAEYMALPVLAIFAGAVVLMYVKIVLLHCGCLSVFCLCMG